MTVPIDGFLSLREADLQVVLDLTGGRLPAVVHWGAELGALSAGGRLRTRPRRASTRLR